MKTVVYPGTFDPIHNGHVDVIERASTMFDKVIVVIAVNSKKTTLFSLDERVEMLEDALKHIDNVELTTTKGLLVETAKENDAIAIIRGVRTVTDFDYEMQIALMNRKMSDLPTLFMAPHEKYSYLNSSIIREISKYNQDVGEFVPELAKKLLQEKFI